MGGRWRDLSGRRAALRRSAVATAHALAAGRPPVVGASILAYHDVEPTRSTFYSVTPQALRSQLERVPRVGCTFVALEDLLARWRSGDPVDGLVAVTFDDALLGIHEHALSILTELGVPATVFVVTEGLGREPAWWPGSRRAMTDAELSEVVDAGLEIGSHTRSHTSLTTLDDAQLERELRGSKDELEDRLGRSVPLVAYPNGHFDARVRAATASAGYEAACTFLGGRLLPGVDPFRIPRLNMGVWHTRLKMTFDLVRHPDSWLDTQLDAKLD